jgi:hypothetical protein
MCKNGVIGSIELTQALRFLGSPAVRLGQQILRSFLVNVDWTSRSSVAFWSSLDWVAFFALVISPSFSGLDIDLHHMAIEVEKEQERGTVSLNPPISTN